MRLGVDIGGTKTDIVLVERDLIVARHRTASGFGASEVVACAASAVAATLDKAGISMGDVASVGVGVPGGVVDGVVTHALNLGIERLDLATALDAAWGVRPVIDNDVNVAALGAWALGGRTATSLAYLNLGTGLAAGVIVDGHVLRGARGTAGEIGHVSVDPNGPLGADGLAGALENYASGSGIVRQWGVPAASARDVLDAAAREHPEAMAIRDGLFFGVASAVRLLILTFDVDTVVIGGGLAAYGDELLAGTTRVLERWEEASGFLASLDVPGRIRLADGEVPVAALGAAELGARRG